jgi:hypothetical protein
MNCQPNVPGLLSDLGEIRHGASERYSVIHDFRENQRAGKAVLVLGASKKLYRDAAYLGRKEIRNRICALRHGERNLYSYAERILASRTCCR